MADRDAWEQPLYRFAAVLLQDAELARKITLETLEAAVLKPPTHDEERLAMFLFQAVRRRALKSRATGTTGGTARGELPAGPADVVARATPARVEAALHALPEPGRSALALLVLDTMEADNVAKLLGLGEAEFANILHGARLALLAALSVEEPAPTTQPEIAP
ncbi:MAG TPA: hypothetical protein VIM61_08360 [Chthoniobacterales bacterium]|jgi:DNA-directed RNA polymerase specialized sigma24 family protein